MKNKIVKAFVLFGMLGIFVTVKPTDTFAKTVDTVKIEKGTVVYTGNDFLAIRKGASTSSEMIGKLTKNCGAVKTGAREGDWVEVTSGEIKGWVYEKDTISGKDLQKYVLDNLKDIDVDVVTKKVTGQYQEKEDTKEDINYTLKGVLQRDGITLYQTPTLTEKRQDKKAKKDFVRINEDGTRIRSKESTKDSLVYGLENKGIDFSYIGETDNWYKVSYKGKDAYIRKDCAKKIVKEVELNNIANVDYIVNAMYQIENVKDGITKITIKDKDYYVSTDDVYYIYLKEDDCKATNIVGKEMSYDLSKSLKGSYKVDVTNPSSDTTLQMYMSKDDCYLEASFDEAEEYEEQKKNGKSDSDLDLNQITDKTKSQYKDKYNYVWDNSSTDERNDIINYACQFLGNPYRYGGTSLTHGIDCSAYCMKILQHFGIDIGRDSNTQYTEKRGKNIDAKDIQPGDLIYYSSNGGKSTYHVVMYLGDGKCINASCRKYGICISNINYEDICAIKNYID